MPARREAHDPDHIMARIWPVHAKPTSSLGNQRNSPPAGGDTNRRADSSQHPLTNRSTANTTNAHTDKDGTAEEPLAELGEMAQKYASLPPPGICRRPPAQRPKINRTEEFAGHIGIARTIHGRG